MGWEPETLQDRTGELRERAGQGPRSGREARLWTRRYGPAMEGENPPVLCTCGRTVPADMMVRVPAALAPAFPGQAYACDGCRERAVLEGRVPRPRLLEALGAPAEKVAELRRRGR